MSVRDEIDTGDHVWHQPTRETWLVAYARDGLVFWCGWPYGCADAIHCRLVYKATPVERHKLLLEMAAMNDQSDGRCRHARHVLQQLAAAMNDDDIVRSVCGK